MSFFTKIRDTVENVVAAPVVLTGAPVQKLTSTGAQQSGFGQAVNIAQKGSLAIGTGIAATVVAGPVAGGVAGSSIGKRFWSGPVPFQQPTGVSDYYTDESPNVSTVASGGDVGEVSNANSVANALKSLTGQVSKLASVGAGARRNASPAPTPGSNLVAAPQASGPLVVPVTQQAPALPGGMLLPIAAIALIALKLL